MVVLKKLIIAPFFLIVFSILIYSLNPLFSSYDLIFNLSLSTLIQLLTLSALILLSSLFFVLFATLASDWKLILPVGILSSTLHLVLTNPSLGLIITVGTLASLFLTYLTLESSLKNYLNFKPSSVLGPPIRHLSTLLVVILSISFFFSTNKIIQEKGFEIPDSLIDTALNLTSSSLPSDEVEQPTLPQITPEQIELLKKNPDLLKQYGLDPKILDSLDKPADKSSTKPNQALIKQAVKDQLQGVIKPYLGFVPISLAVLLFITLESLVSFLTILIYPLLWLIFYILEKTGFVKFTTETREVKKIVIN